MKKIWVVRNVKTGKYVACSEIKNEYIADINRAEIYSAKPRFSLRKNEVAIQVEIVPIEWGSK